VYSDEIKKQLDLIVNTENYKNKIIKIWENYHGIKYSLKNPQTFNNFLLNRYFNFDQNSILKYVDKIQFKIEMEKLGFKELIIKSYFSTYDLSEFLNLKLIDDWFPLILKFNNETEGENLFVFQNQNDFLSKKNEIINIFKEKISKFNSNNNLTFSETWCYSKIKPGILIEKFLSKNNVYAKDYKIFAFNSGENVLLTQNYENVFENNYDWNLFETTFIDINLNEVSSEIIKMNKISNEILRILKIKHLRVDFYIFENKIYLGEFTFLTSNAFCSFYKSGSFLEIDEKWMKKIN